VTLTHWILIALHFILAPIAAIHALIYKRDSRAAFGWIAVCFFFPLAGPILYSLFGINRIRTRAKRLRSRSPLLPVSDQKVVEGPAGLPAEVREMPEEYAQLALISERVTRRPVLGGNSLEILYNGEQAYPPMIEAIEGARESLFLSTYILETNSTGRMFIKALGDAVRRGVNVRVLIDGIGEKYSSPRASRLLRKERVPVAVFLAPKLFPPSLYINLRNHRKLLVSDGTLAFCGGMNIGDRHLAQDLYNPSRVADVHFRITGPVARQLQHVFLETWAFCLGKHPDPAPGDTGPKDRSSVLCRTIVEGPDEDLDKLANILVGAVSAARRKVLIMTPYFLPSRELLGALQAASLRGVDVTVILPAKNNLPMVHWATRNMLWELLKFGVRVFYQPPPFNHSKLFVADDHYALIGSANIDPRSLRLNFELVLEVFDPPFAGSLTEHFRRTLENSREVSFEEVDNRPLPVRIRDAFCWLFTPYL